MLVEGDLSRADFAFHAWKRGTHAVVFDIDATLTTSDLQMVMSFAADLFGGSFSPTAYEGGAELTRALAAKGYKIIYLTARPDYMRSLTDKWLKDGGYAAGVVYTTNVAFSLTPPSKADQLAYKKARMADLVTTRGISIDYAYGNAEHDVEAYQSVGIPNSRIFTIGDLAGVRGSTAIRDNYCDHLDSARNYPTPGQP
jgi:phosphatidate phosphatase PAH1